MNRLLTDNNGGHPLELDDFRWWQEGNAEAFLALAKIFGDSFIVSGFVASGIGTTNTTWTAGYVVLNGEVCAVDASAAAINTQANPYLYVELDITYEADGLETFENTAQVDTYEIRKAKIVAYAAAQAGKVSYIGLKTAETILNEKILDYSHAFTKRQSWAQGSDNAGVGGNNVLILSDPTAGNIWNFNVDLVDTPLIRFNNVYPNGTLMAVRFTSAGTGTVKIDDGTAFNYGIDTGGKTYLFKAGELAVFWWTGGKARLVNRDRLAEQWVTMTSTTAGTFAAGISGAIKLRLLDNGDVAITGFLSIDFTTYTNILTPICTLPDDKYKPTFQQSFIAGNDSADDVKVMNVAANGNITLGALGSNTVGYTINTRISILS